MPSTTDQRTRLARWLYLLTPFAAAVLAIDANALGVDRWLQDRMPSGIATYTNVALHAAPFSWFLLAAGCAFGTALDYARRTGVKGMRFALYLVCGMAIVFATQVVVCVALLLSAMSLIGYV